MAPTTLAEAGMMELIQNQSVQQLSRSMDKVFEDAQLTGILDLSGRNLKEFPSAATKFDLNDTVEAGKINF
jgi:hypothetical protein